MISSGRPPKYSKKHKVAVAQMLNNGASIESIARKDGMPSSSLISSWLNDGELNSLIDPRSKKLYAGRNRYLRKIGNKPYQMRVSVSCGKNKVAKVMIMSLKTKDLKEARASRDAILHLFKTQGLEVCSRYS